MTSISDTSSSFVPGSPVAETSGRASRRVSRALLASGECEEGKETGVTFPFAVSNDAHEDASAEPYRIRQSTKRCEGNTKNWKQCRRNATRTLLELPIPPGLKPEDRHFHYCDEHAGEVLAGGLAKEIHLEATAGRGPTDASYVEAAPVAHEPLSPARGQKRAPAAGDLASPAPALRETYGNKQSKSTDISCGVAR